VLEHRLGPFHLMTQELQRNIGDSQMNGAIFDVLPCMETATSI